MQNDDSVFLRARGFFRKNPVARVLLLIVILFAATYGGVEVLRVALQTESPLMVVSSGSMIPTLNVGDIILVRSIDPKAVTVGMIIIFHSPIDYNVPIVHRVIAVVNQGGSIFFETKGDNNGARDNWLVPPQNLMGVYVAKLPYLGLLSLELHGPAGEVLIILLIILIIAIEYKSSRSKPSQT